MRPVQAFVAQLKPYHKVQQGFTHLVYWSTRFICINLGPARDSQPEALQQDSNPAHFPLVSPAGTELFVPSPLRHTLVLALPYALWVGIQHVPILLPLDGGALTASHGLASSP